MPENKRISLPIQTPDTSERKSNKKKKRRRRRRERSRNTVSSSSAPSHETPQSVSLHPLSLLPPHSPALPRGPLPKQRATGRKGGEQSSGSGWRSKKLPKSLTPTNKTSASGAPVQGCVSVPSTQARESLRWEGELEDPQAEEERLELYRSNRRQRYITHRAALFKDSQDALTQAECKEPRL